MIEERRAACLHADVCGYCRLIATDTQSTVRTLTVYRAVMSSVIAKHSGRVVDTAGDSLLAEFRNVSDAIWCALDMQRELENHNAVLPPSRRLEFRVGIDLGNVLVEDGRIYGDCVNIAARVQQMAAPGSVCLAASAYDQIDAALPLRFEYLGQHMFKNMDTPLGIYRVA